MAWRVEGSFLEACPCDMVCPCITSGFTAPADVDPCRMVLAFHIDSGEIEGVDVSGLNVAMIGETPPVMGDGNWRVGMFMDAAASKEQADKLGAVFSGQLGGPMAWFAKFVGENLGAEVVPIEYVDDGRRHRVRIGDLGEIEVEDFRAPQTPQEVAPLAYAGEIYKLTDILHPVSSTVNLARPITSRVNAFGLELSGEGKFGDSTRFSWAG
ncbi:MAG TPA: DUF1326 domain-containing protein [Actinomycetes bacterium]|nr:DUF1326 domain-containing protein [Actinomycetes bacterium]